MTGNHDERLLDRPLATRGIKAGAPDVPIPVSYGFEFEGERLREEERGAVLGGDRLATCEYLCLRDAEEVSDGRVELVGDDVAARGTPVMSFGILVEVAAKSFSKDFEPVLERQIHRYLNGAQGVVHRGQRDRFQIQIAREALEKGFSLRHLGLILHVMLRHDCGAVVDKVQVKIFTSDEDVVRMRAEARAAFCARDRRLKTLTDEDVDVFYSCSICQSYAPNHVCIITPQRPGACGAFSWQDAKVACGLVPSGGSQPIAKGKCVDGRLGQWEGVNDVVFAASNRTIREICVYSHLVSPSSSCGCFECLAVLIPEANGVMVVDRAYAGSTPLGLGFGELAGLAGLGVQTPGFLGVARQGLSSPKFISAEGGLKRLVWMSKELKEALRPQLEERAQVLGLDGFYDRLADESVVLSLDELLVFLKSKSHPVLGMPPILQGSTH